MQPLKVLIYATFNLVFLPRSTIFFIGTFIIKTCDTWTHSKCHRGQRQRGVGAVPRRVQVSRAGIEGERPQALLRRRNSHARATEEPL